MKFPYLTVSAFFSGVLTGASVAGKFGFTGPAYLGISLFVGLWGATMVEVLGLTLMIGAILATFAKLRVAREISKLKP